MDTLSEISFSNLSRVAYKLYQLCGQIAGSVILDRLHQNKDELNQLCEKVNSSSIYYKGNIYTYQGSLNLPAKSLILEPKDEDTLEEILAIHQKILEDKEYFFQELSLHCTNDNISDCLRKIPRVCNDIDVLRNIFPEYVYTVLKYYFEKEDDIRCIDPIVTLPPEFEEKFSYYIGLSLL